MHYPLAQQGQHVCPAQKQYDEIALDDDASLTGRQLVKYRFRGIEHEATTWVDMYVQVLKELHNIDTAYLNYLAGADDSIDLASQFSRIEDGLDTSVLVAEGIYVNTGTSTQHKLNMLRRLFEHYDQDPSDLVFFLNEKKYSDEDLLCVIRCVENTGCRSFLQFVPRQALSIMSLRPKTIICPAPRIVLVSSYLAWRTTIKPV